MRTSKQIISVVRKLLHNNRFVAVFSLVCAIFFWLGISMTQTPEITRDIEGVQVVINTQGTKAEELKLEVFANNIPKSTTVKVRGPYYIVSSLKSTDLIVNANVAKVVEAGEYNIELTARRNSSKTGYEILSSEIKEIRNVKFDVKDEVTKEVWPYLDNVELDAAAKQNGYKVGTADVANSLYRSITIQGPQSDIAKIKQVRAVISNKVLSATEKFLVDIIIIDQDEKEMDKSLFTLDFEQVEVTVPVVMEKEVNVELKFDPATIKGLKYECPQKVTIIGEPSVVNGISSVPLTIDLSKFSSKDAVGGKYTYAASANLPSNVEIVGAPNRTIDVVFNLSGYTTKTITVNSSQIKIGNLSEGLSAELMDTSITINLCGPSYEINYITSPKINVIADCAGKTASNQQSVECVISIPGYSSTWAYGDPTIRVKINEN